DGKESRGRPTASRWGGRACGRPHRIDWPHHHIDDACAWVSGRCGGQSAQHPRIGGCLVRRHHGARLSASAMRLAPLEVLDFTLVLLRRRPRGKRSQVLPSPSMRIFLARIKPVLTCFQFPYHNFRTCLYELCLPSNVSSMKILLLLVLASSARAASDQQIAA